jgi:uncharacterized phage protein (TIGR01671 family)
MREILFRGKRIGNGEWVYGNYCAAEYISGDGIEHLIIEVPRNGASAKIVPETVGQFTGLTDKNGKRIFEGDIIEGHCHSQWSHRLQRCAVVYDRDGFEARHYVVQGDQVRYYSYKVLFSKDVVVIGNVHENPELLN